MGPGGVEPPTSRLSGVRSNQAELRAPKKTGARPLRSRRRVGRRADSILRARRGGFKFLGRRGFHSWARHLPPGVILDRNRQLPPAGRGLATGERGPG